MFQNNCRGKKILVVEADFVDRETLSMALAAEGYRVPAAATPAEALEILRSPEKPDLILVDLTSPQQSSRDFYTTLEQWSDFSTIPTIIVCPKERAGRLTTSRSIQCLAEPPDVTHLVERINSYLGVANGATLSTI